MTETTLIDKPSVTFKQKAIMWFGGTGSEKIWSTSQELNTLIDPSHFFFPSFQVSALHGPSAYSTNNYTIPDDPKANMFTFKVGIPLATNEIVQYLNLMLFFQYRLAVRAMCAQCLLFSL